jgi:hypothetical protein
LERSPVEDRPSAGGCRSGESSLFVAISGRVTHHSGSGKVSNDDGRKKSLTNNFVSGAEFGPEYLGVRGGGNGDAVVTKWVARDGMVTLPGARPVVHSGRRITRKRQGE